MLTGQDRVKRLRWLCRRGMKELDVLLEAFLETQADSLSAGGWPVFEEFLENEDDVLLDWISGKNLPQTPDVLLLINTLTRAI